MRELINETTLDLIDGWLSEEWWTSEYIGHDEKAELIACLSEIRGMMSLRNELVSRIKVEDVWKIEPEFAKKFMVDPNSLKVSANE